MTDHLPFGAESVIARYGSIGASGRNMDGTVARTSGSAELPYTNAELEPDSLQIVGADLYFVDRSWAKVKRVPLAGGPVVDVFTPTQPPAGPRVRLEAFSVRGQDLFWADSGSPGSPGHVYRTNLTSGVTQPLALNVPSIREFLVDDTGVYWVSQAGSATTGWTQTLYGVPHGSTGAQLLFTQTPPLAIPWRLRSDADALYFFRDDTLSVQRFDKQTRTQTQILYGFRPMGLVVHGPDVYWSQLDCVQFSGGSCVANEVRVKKGRAAGGGPLMGTVVTSFASTGVSADILRTRGSCLYFNGVGQGVYAVER